MNLTTKGRYAVMAMVDLAMREGVKPVVLADIAHSQNIALSYLEQIFLKLRKAGIVHSVKGPGGGYVMAAPADKVLISDIILAVDESIKMTRCGESAKNGCMHKQAKCMTHNLWKGLSDQIYGYLNKISLADVCNRNKPVIEACQYYKGEINA